MKGKRRKSFYQTDAKRDAPEAEVTHGASNKSMAEIRYSAFASLRYFFANSTFAKSSQSTSTSSPDPV
jgi:hypothetical protein